MWHVCWGKTTVLGEATEAPIFLNMKMAEAKFPASRRASGLFCFLFLKRESS